MNMGNCQVGAMLTLHEDAFYEFFRPYRHSQASCDIWGGIGLETFGEDLELVKSLPVESVWTVVDGGDDSDQWILPGIHTVNRICYLTTEVSHGWKDIQLKPNHLNYRTMRSKPIASHSLLPARGYSLTSLGLKRQVNKLGRAIPSI